MIDVDQPELRGQQRPSELRLAQVFDRVSEAVVQQDRDARAALVLEVDPSRAVTVLGVGPPFLLRVA